MAGYRTYRASNAVQLNLHLITPPEERAIIAHLRE
jgi:hypothetical protein